MSHVLNDFRPLKPAEEKLLRCTLSGKVASFSAHRPEQATSENTIRADFLRFLIMGGDKVNIVHEQGVRLRGAYIEGILDLRSSKIPTAFLLQNCLCFNTLFLNNASIDGRVSLDGSAWAGVQAPLVSIAGSLSIRQLFSFGSINLLGAKIEGSLTLSESSIDGRGFAAIRADRIQISGNLNMRGGFSSIGDVSLAGITLNGQLNCTSCRIIAVKDVSLAMDGSVIKGNVNLSTDFRSEGTVRLSGANIGGQLNFTGARLDGRGGYALIAQSAFIAGSLIVKGLAIPLQKALLNNTKVRTLTDDAKSWGEGLQLDGFTYDFLSNGAKAKTRLAWLDKQIPSAAGTNGSKGEKSGFRPQPWRHLKHKLEEMGHADEAQEVGIAFERRLREVGSVGKRTAHWPRGFRWLGIVPHVLYGALTGYGYRPMRLLAWILGIWLAFTTVYWYAAVEQNVFAPSNPLVFQSDAYTTCRKEYGEGWQKRSPDTPIPSGIGNWYTCDALRGEYTGFSPGAYSLDILLSLVDLQQEKDWGPITTTPSPNAWVEFWNWDWGHSIRFLVWLETLIGWGISLLLVAIVSGLTRRKE
ncbi:hypothetical protein [Pseudomonas chlororaphis]|uniref:hypothetical protein n=1 Tax=Pseudomonas chlororaphis TaxID=587753 RepID=UPI0023668AF3|nr:hypothetical protein [Pseudomonas chlororaphis]WDH20538.1 hypothetical protein PUP50_21290 [Pseudomonas chlororaphis]